MLLAVIKFTQLLPPTLLSLTNRMLLLLLRLPVLVLATSGSPSLSILTAATVGTF